LAQQWASRTLLTGWLGLTVRSVEIEVGGKTDTIAFIPTEFSGNKHVITTHKFRSALKAYRGGGEIRKKVLTPLGSVFLG